MTRFASLAFTAALLLALNAKASGALAQAAPARDPIARSALNPQPLPPKSRLRNVRRDPSTGKAIIIVSGKDWRKTRRKPGSSVMLNPQPLPPKVLRAR